MAFIAVGDHVWVEPQIRGEYAIAIGARVERVEGAQVVLIDDQGQEVIIERSVAEGLKHMHPSSVEGVQDMIKLGDLDEAGILRNLLIRYRNHQIYTYVGSVLVAVNPYSQFSIYDNTFINRYHNSNAPLPPHIYATAEQAYVLMKREEHNQCIIISGESGAGKTESTKFILQYLTAVSGQHSTIEQQILDANPILEAFGNAKTIRNDNSSRFGKYIDVHFNMAWAIEGAKIDQYLLEQSRIVLQMPDERNYHIFYRMLAGMTKQEKQSLRLTQAQDYYYLSQGNCFTCEGMNEAREFEIIKNAMKALWFTDDEMQFIFRTMAAVLHLGNISFEARMDGNLEACDVMNQRTLRVAAELLQVPADGMQQAFTMKSTFAEGEIIYSPVGVERATDIRDAFVKGLYGKVFIWIVNKINSSIFKPREKDALHSRVSIGVLDIFGFEKFEMNSFEQLCINYANENLQQFFVAQIFKNEQDEYKREGIEWNFISFVDNQEVIDMLARKPMNFIALIDEESRFPQGTDETFLHKLNHNHKENKYYVRPKSMAQSQFGVVHYAGTVYYESTGFLDKNRNTFSADLVELISECKCNYLLDMFFKERSMGTETRKRSPTLGVQFRRSLDVLMKTLSGCHSSFVRCVKPNHHKKPMEFDRTLCWQQLQYSGMLETVRIRKAGYAMRHTFEDFVTRYHMLVRENLRDFSTRDTVIHIAMSLLGTSGWEMGTKRIFLKEHQDTFLEHTRAQILTRKIIFLQRMIRRYIRMRRVRRVRQGAVTIQTRWRGYREKKAYITMRRGFSRLQATFRARKLTAQLKRELLLRKKLEQRRIEQAKRRQEEERERREEEERKRNEDEQRRKVEEKRREEEARKREEDERWMKEQERRRRERMLQKKKDEEARAKVAETARRQRVQHPLNVLQGINMSTDGVSLQNAHPPSGRLLDLIGSAYGSQSLLGSRVTNPQSLSSALSSLSSPGSGWNTTAFAISLLTFSMAMGVSNATDEHHSVSAQSTSPAELRTVKPVRGFERPKKCEFISPLRTVAKGPQLAQGSRGARGPQEARGSQGAWGPQGNRL